MELTLAQLVAIMPYAKKRASLFLAPLNAAMQEFSINTHLRMAAFLAQTGHESGQLLYTEEIASGSAYEGRKDLGNTHPGWGVLYKGRGLIQITGFYNYTAVMMALDIPCVEHPEILKEPVNACRSAAWYWSDRGLNALADQGTDESFTTITRRVNGGLNGIQDRLSLYHTAKEVLCSQSQK
jgi:putative chitinase